ncbi:MAG TPA: DUF4190 domain-containing protein, partial [Pyrinomonadaceae bacterium]|nr:DUF4190 domain-containing protein [Pyrinomonadaceae bacterium]
MGSVKCNRCGMVGWSGAAVCKGCGNPLVVTSQQNYQQWNAQGAHGYAAGGDQTKKRVGMAVASLVFGIISLPTLGLLGVGAILGIVLGIVALGKAKNQPTEYGGRGLAIGGIVMSVLSLVLIVPVGIISAIAIPNLLAARRAANEGSAIGTMRRLATAELTYQSTVGDGKFGDMTELEAADLIRDANLARGFKNGYFFKVTPLGETFEVSASPVKYPSDGARSFYYSLSDDTIRAADKRGLSADAEDPPLPEYTERQTTRPTNSSLPSRKSDPFSTETEPTRTS